MSPAPSPLGWPLDTGRPPGLVARIVRLNLFVTELLEGIAASAGMTVADYLVLGVVRRSPEGRTTPTHICEILGRTTGGMTTTLDRLEAAGWLQRSHDDGDRRRVIVALTDAGTDMASTINEALHRWEDSLGLSARRRAETESLVDGLLDLFEHHMGVDDRPPPRKVGQRGGAN